MGRIIASGNIKGGTGKSTVALNAGCAFAARGWRAVVIDIDPQGSATAWSRLGHAPIEVAAEPLLDLRGPGRWHARAMELARSRDVVILDLPPLVTSVIASACLLADLVVVPVTPSAIDVPPTEETLRLIRTARASQRGGRPKALLVPNKVDRRGGYDEATRTAVMGLGERWGPTLHFSLDFVNAFAAGGWVGGHAPDSQAAAEIEALVLRLEKVLGLAPPPEGSQAGAPPASGVAPAG